MTKTAQVEDDSVLITAKTGAERLEEQREAIAQELEEMVGEIRSLRQKLKAGEARKSGEDGKLLGELRYWLRAGRETEAEIEAIRRKDAGIVDEYGLDLDAAVAAIGCRLARVRACCCEGEIPE